MKNNLKLDDATKQAIESAYNAAQQQREAGNLAGAEPIYRKIIEMDPKHFGAMYHLAVLLMDQRRFKEALPLLKKSLPAVSSSVQAQTNMGVTLQNVGKPDMAKTYLQKALKIKPDYAIALDALGVLFVDQHDFAQAENFFKKSITSNPEFTQSYYNYAAMLERLNRLDEARTMAETAMKLSPDSIHVRFMLAKILRRQKRNEDALPVLEGGNPDGHHIAEAYYSEMGQLYDQLDRTADAFEAFRKSNTLQTYSQSFIIGDKKRIFPNLIKQYRNVVAPEWYGTWTQAPAENPNEDPVFLIGFPRSGTTLLDQIMTAQGDFEVAEECEALSTLIKKIEKTHKNFPACFACMKADEIISLRRRYVADLKKMGGLDDGKRPVEKMPLHVIHTPLIHRLYPHGKIIFALRHPCDVVLSCFMQQFKLNPAMMHFLDLRDAAVFYDDTMNLWEQCRQVLPLDYTVARYENVVANFRDEIGALLKFLDAPWNDSVLEFDRVARERGAINTPSYSQVTQKIYKSSSGRWLKYRQQMEPVLPILEPWVKKFGYEME